MEPLHSFLKFGELIIFILNNMYDGVYFESPQHNIFKNHKTSMIHVQTLKYSLEGCVLALLAARFFFIFVNTTTTKAVNFHSHHLRVL